MTLFIRQNDFAKALQLYQSALPHMSQSADLHSNIGQLFYKLKDMPRSIESYRRAIELDAAILPRVAHMLALAYHYNGEYQLAEQHYELIAPKSAECYFDFAVTLERLGKVLCSFVAAECALLSCLVQAHKL